MRKQISKSIKNSVWEKTGGKCFYCGRQTIPFGNFNMSFHIDHLVPYSRGGKDTIKNLIPSCRGCNIERGNKNLTAFLWERKSSGGAWGMNIVDWSEAKKDPEYVTDEEYVRL